MPASRDLRDLALVADRVRSGRPLAEEWSQH